MQNLISFAFVVYHFVIYLQGNSFYLGFWLEHMVAEITTHGTWWALILQPLPAIITLFRIIPETLRVCVRPSQSRDRKNVFSESVPVLSLVLQLSVVPVLAGCVSCTPGWL